MGLEIIIIAETNQRQISYDITYMCNLKKDLIELIYKTEITYRQKTNMITEGGKVGEGEN